MNKCRSAVTQTGRSTAVLEPIKVTIWDAPVASTVGCKSESGQTCRLDAWAASRAGYALLR